MGGSKKQSKLNELNFIPIFIFCYMYICITFLFVLLIVLLCVLSFCHSIFHPLLIYQSIVQSKMKH